MKMTKMFWKKLAALIFPMLLLGAFNTVNAQTCNPTYTAGNECQNVAIPFKANAPGFTSYNWEFKNKATSVVVGTSKDRDPLFTFSQPGTYQVTLNASGIAGNCSKTIEVIVKPSPTAKPIRIVEKRQCFNGNYFCYIDSSAPAPGSKIVRRTIVFTDGARYDKFNPTRGDTFCHSIIDPKGGWFSFKMELEDSNGCVTEAYFDSAFQVFPRLNVKLLSNQPVKCDSTKATITNQTYVDWKNDPTTTVGLKDIAQFVFDFGNGVIIGDSVTNTSFWTGNTKPGDDGKVERWYYANGTYNATLSVTTKFGCTESYTYKAAATNIRLDKRIVADVDSSCTSEPEVCFRLANLDGSNGAVPGASILWDFGGLTPGNGYPFNNDDKDWTPCRPFGGGPWMISLRVRSGPCDVMFFDTITKVGPSSTIEIPGNRIAEHERYQCTIRDSVHFPNFSSFYHDDNNYWDEDSFMFFFPKSVSVITHKVTRLDSIYVFHNSGKNNDAGKMNQDTFISKHSIYDRLTIDGHTIFLDTAGVDSFTIITPSNDTIRYPSTLGGIKRQRRFVFNYNVKTRAPYVVPSPPWPGPQGIFQANPNVRRKDNVIRLWTLGDNFAPQCTTDTKANKNVNLNCNYTLDSLPVHWYTPWDDIYRYRNNGQFYTTPAARTMFSRNARQCYQVQVYADDTVRVPQEVVLFVPRDSARTFFIPYVDSFGVMRTDTFEVKRYLNYPEFTQMNNYRLKIWRPKSKYKGEVINTVIWEDQEYFIPAGVTLPIKNLQNGMYRYVTGPKLEKIKKDEQFEVALGDSIIAQSSMTINAAKAVPAAPSTILVDTVINGVDSFVQRQEIIVDSAYHRTMFYKTRANCNSITLWHKDTVHPFKCESSGTAMLALLPPNARGMRIESGIPCPQDGNKLQYYLNFDMSETKPGCTQQWFEVNYDSLTGPTNWLNYKSGQVLAPPPPGTPLPFVLPYQIVGAWGNKFTKVYTSGEIGQDPNQRPNGSFTPGLIVGNGPPRFDAAGNPIAPECTDTAWYSDMFRYQYLDAQFDILIPQNNPKAICAGETAYFRLRNPIQDSIKSLRWNWGYPDRLSGYYEEFHYFKPYKGPQKGRNDEGTQWDNSKKWLYNYIVRHDLDQLFGDVTLDTIVTRIYRDWDFEVNTFAADKILVEILKSLNLDIRDIDPADFALMLGDGTVGCIDTTGISEYFVIGKKGIDKNVKFDGRYKYQYDDPNDPISKMRIIEEVFHFRDSSLQGYDTLVAPYDIVAGDTSWKRGQVIPGVYKFTYVHPEVKLNFCDPTKSDTIWKRSNGPMTPGLNIDNNKGCQKTDAKLLNVGFLNRFELIEEAVCQNQVHELYDSVRYWQYGDQMFPFDYPIDPRKFWDDPQRFGQNKEKKAIDWNADDSIVKFDRSLKFFHQYDEPGEYRVAIATEDSIGCKDTAYVTAMVTGIVANFETNTVGDPCDGIRNFYDSSIVFDPCRGRDTCPNGVYEPCDSVIWYEWDFGDGSTRSVLKNPSHDYTSSGWFTVKLKIYSLLGCTDSVEKQIYIKGPQPEFEFDGFNPWGEDSTVICVGDSVELANISRDPMFNPSWIVYWGDSANSTSSSTDLSKNFIHQYNEAGVYYLLMYMEDTIEGSADRCFRIFPDTSTKDGKIPRKIKVIVNPVAPAVLGISDTIVCPHELVTFTDQSDTIYKYYQWSFGDGDTATRSYPTNSVGHAYTNPGTYKVELIPNYDLPPGDFGPKCLARDSGTVVVEDVSAYFEVDEKNKPDFCFVNKSTNGVKYWWYIPEEPLPTDTFGTSVEIPTDDINYVPCKNWQEKLGDYRICLIAENDNGCRDTFCDIVKNEFYPEFIPYNIFTPDDEDALNKTFVIDLEAWETYDITIYNRWGEVVFKANHILDRLDPSTNNVIHWDGTINNEGKVKCPEGTYFWVINYQLRTREKNDGVNNGKAVSGTVTLLR